MKMRHFTRNQSEVKKMQNAYIVTGSLIDAHTVTLDEALPLTPVKVRLAVEPLETKSRRSYHEVMAEIRQRQQARGHQPPTREAVDTYDASARLSLNPV
jgi:hypothetical protein